MLKELTLSRSVFAFEIILRNYCLDLLKELIYSHSVFAFSNILHNYCLDLLKELIFPRSFFAFENLSVLVYWKSAAVSYKGLGKWSRNDILFF